MTKKHYEAIAQALRSSKPANDGGHNDTLKFTQWQFTAAAITVAIREFNPLFDQARFEKAAGLLD